MDEISDNRFFNNKLENVLKTDNPYIIWAEFSSIIPPLPQLYWLKPSNGMVSGELRAKCTLKTGLKNYNPSSL